MDASQNGAGVAVHEGWRTRVERELRELTQRLVDLQAFLGSSMVNTVPEHHRHLMWAQAHTMAEYQHILQMRLAEDDKYRKELEASARRDVLTGQPHDPANDPLAKPE